MSRRAPPLQTALGGIEETVAVFANGLEPRLPNSKVRINDMARLQGMIFAEGFQTPAYTIPASPNATGRIQDACPDTQLVDDPGFPTPESIRQFMEHPGLHAKMRDLKDTYGTALREQAETVRQNATYFCEGVFMQCKGKTETTEGDRARANAMLDVIEHVFKEVAGVEFNFHDSNVEELRSVA